MGAGRLATLTAACAAALVPAAAQAASRCTPDGLDRSARLPGGILVSPMPGSRAASTTTQVSILGAAPGSLSKITVTGSHTGPHAGVLRPYSQGDGASFVPSRAFVRGESVAVRGTVTQGRRARRWAYRFTVGYTDPVALRPESTRPAGSASQVQSFVSRSDLRPPALSVAHDAPSSGEGYVFTAPYGGPGQYGPAIFDGSGQLVWFRPLPAGTDAADLRVQSYGGQPALSWWQGEITDHGYGVGEGVIADSSYRTIATVRAGNGLQADLHELQLEPNGSAIVTAYRPLRCDLSALGASADGAVTDGIFQAIDVRTGLVRMEWDSVDHVALADSFESVLDSSPQWPFDFFHINSVNVDRDGSLLVSSRNTWAAYALDANTGQIEWRLGGRHSSFHMGTGTGTAWQHDARQLPDGSFSLFDNGASPKAHSQSRGIVLRVDPVRRTVTLARRVVHAVPIVAASQGNFQDLDDGDAFIGWGSEPYLSEQSATGATLFDAHFARFTQSYRAFRMPWSGSPVELPAVATRSLVAGTLTVFASWNGATDVARWALLGGDSTASMSVLTSAPCDGFETAIAVPSPLPRYLAVQARDASGAVLGTSPTISGRGSG